MAGNIEMVRGDVEKARKRKRRNGFMKESAGALVVSIFGHMRLGSVRYSLLNRIYNSRIYNNKIYINRIFR